MKENLEEVRGRTELQNNMKLIHVTYAYRNMLINNNSTKK